jgi:hypothetical protein
MLTILLNTLNLFHHFSFPFDFNVKNGELKIEFKSLINNN